jgi:hypothetical protein
MSITIRRTLIAVCVVCTAGFIMLIFYGFGAYAFGYPPMWFFMALGASFCGALTAGLAAAVLPSRVR